MEPVRPMSPPAVSLTEFTDGLWLDAAPVRFAGMRMESTMTVVRLGGGALLLYSPVAMTPARRAAVDALGGVAHLYAPSVFHHAWLGEWAAAYPNARVHAPAALRKKRPDLRIDREHDASPLEPAFAGVLDEVHIDGCRLEETVLCYRPARTLLVADLVHNIGRPEHTWTHWYSRAMGFYDRVALSRALRWTAFSSRAAARESVDRVLALPFESLVVGHGAPIESGARESLAAAYDWLPRGVAVQQRQAGRTLFGQPCG